MDPHARRHPILDGFWRPLHFFGGLAVIPAGAEVLAFALDAHQGADRPPDLTVRAALTERSVGAGHVILIAPDVTGSIVRIQQGIPVHRDGVSAPDGSASRADGILKSDDGAVLDWILDRSSVPGIPGYQAFLDPVADRWREVLLRAIFHAARTIGVSLPVLWLYPRNLPALAHLSHDTDLCEVDHAHMLLDVLRQERVTSTWCVVLPGYPPETIDAIRQAGHELGMHFDALSEGAAWSEQEFRRQHARLTELLGGPPCTNKNHYLRWEGDADLFEWCARSGVALDQSKGASKTGEAGFLFGTCHPYRPVAPTGEWIDVLELPTPVQDFVVFCPVEVGDPLAEAVARVHGILHLLFHPAHIARPGVVDALRRAIAGARALGMECWTAREIALWENRRRSVRWDASPGPGGSRRTTLTAPTDLPDATVLWLDVGSTPVLTIDGDDVPAVPVERWGFPFVAATFDIEAGRVHVLEGPR
jgi:peptidoglycan/xylan/chitin deacetylase (PgdA/CDA1 family)